MNKKTFYITTPIYYVNDVPHIGHAYTTAAADTIARFKRLKGYEVILLTGTDEHGEKVERAAKGNKETPKELSDRVVSRYKELWKKLNISYDDFIRTTEKRHKDAVLAIFKKIHDKGDIYLGYYEDWYCTPCEAFWTELQLKSGNCPDCGRPTERLKESSYFFKMSNYQNALITHIEKHPDFIQPECRRNEILNFLKSGLRDLSISRTSFNWGIPIPEDQKHILYVWFDALSNYISGIGYGYDDQRFNRFWPADFHIIGKDILRFHAVYWPSFLLSAGIPLPKHIFAHGWWTIEGKKMSKSLNNIVDPNLLIDKYGADAVRYFLLREVPFGLDGDFSHTAMVNRINSDLANDLGNLLQRTVTMIAKYFDGYIPSPDKNYDDEDRVVIKKGGDTVNDFEGALSKLSYNKALISVWELISLANKYIDASAPWKLFKDKERHGKLANVMYNTCESLRLTGILLAPFMPLTSEKILKSFGELSLKDGEWDNKVKWGGLQSGIKTEHIEQLFPRILDDYNTPLPQGERVTKGKGFSQERDNKKMTNAAENKNITPVNTAGNTNNIVTIDQFLSVVLRVGAIKTAERVEKSEKLIKLSVELSQTDVRQIVAGIGKSYSPEQLPGKKIIVVSNLKPAKLMGIESQGMILAASSGDKIVLPEFGGEVDIGARVK